MSAPLRLVVVAEQPGLAVAVADVLRSHGIGAEVDHCLRIDVAACAGALVVADCGAADGRGWAALAAAEAAGWPGPVIALGEGDGRSEAPVAWLPVAHLAELAPMVERVMAAASPPPLAGGVPVHPAGIEAAHLDLIQREQRARSLAELARQRLSFLAEASRILASSLDYQTTLKSMADLVVPYLADHCLVYVVEDDRWIVPLAVADTDPGRAATIGQNLTRAYPLAVDADTRLARMIRLGQSQLVPRLTPEEVETWALAPIEKERFLALGFVSHMFVPLRGRGRLLGALFLGGYDPEKPFDQADLRLAEDLAARAASALDHARLFREAQGAKAAAEAGTERMRRLQGILEALAPVLTEEQAADVVAGMGAAAIGADAGVVLRLDAAAGELRVLRASGPARESLAAGTALPLTGAHPLTDVARTRQPLVIDSPEAWQALGRTGAGWPTGGTCVIAPLALNDQVLGVLAFHFGRFGAFGDDAASFLGTLAHQCAQALVRARLYVAEQTARREVERANSRLAFLAEASQVLASSLDPDTILTRLAELVVPTLADGCLFSLQEEDGYLRHVALRLEPADLQAQADRLMAESQTVGFRRPPGNPLQQVLDDGKPFVLTDITAESWRRLTHSESARQLGLGLDVGALVVVPLYARERLLGTLGLAWRRASDFRDVIDLPLAEDLARRVAVAVQHARLYQDEQQALAVREVALEREQAARSEAEAAQQRFAFLSEAGRILGESLDYERTLSNLLDLVVPVLADTCSIMMRGADGSLFQLAVRHLDPAKQALIQALPAPLPTPDNPLKQVLDSGHTVFLDQLDADLLGRAAVDDTHRAALAAIGFESLLLLPLWANDQVIGLLGLAMTGSGRRFTWAEQAMAAELAERAGMAIERAQLYREEQAAQQRFAFLATVGRILGESLDPRETLPRVFDLVVPTVADVCGMFLPVDGGMERALFRHVDPGKEAEILALPPTRLESANPVLQAVANGQLKCVDRRRGDDPLGMAGNEHHQTILATLGMTSVVYVPLRARERVLGVLALGMVDAVRSFGSSEQALASELADRIALSIDNARLFQEVQQADRRKAEFLAMLGHELRNPLGAIGNALQVLEFHGAPDDPAQRQRAVIERQTQHLARLVSDLLDLARINSGKIELVPAPVDLVGIARHSLVNLEATYPGRQVIVRLPDEPVPIEGDWVRLTQVAVNLLDNALKYTPAGGSITLAVAVTDSEALLQVSDTGRGIPLEMGESIFEPFTQVPTESRGQGGLGLGLTLVRHLVDLHGGRVAVESAGVGAGSCFSVYLPLGSLLPVPEVVTPVAAAAAGRVLVVEDNRDAGETLAELLGLWGYEVELAITGPTGAEAAYQWRPHVALIDIDLPGCDGYEVARRIRQTVGEAVCLVALTGYGQPEDRTRALTAGFDEHLTKPLAFERLREILAAATP